MSLILNIKRFISLAFTSIFICIVLAAQSLGATYYVRNGGNDSADGLSDGNAWSSISKVNSASFVAGDKILFKRGSSWSDTLIPASSGSAASPITFEAYGTGDAPVIDINYDSSKHRNLYVNGKSNIHIKNFRFLNSTSEGSTLYGNVETANSSNITLENLVVSGSFGKAAVLIGNSSNDISVQNCTVETTSFPASANAEGAGVMIGDFTNPNTCYNVTVTDCDVKNNSGAGIVVYESYQNTISGNNIYENGSAGIWIGGASGSYSHDNIVENNHVYENCQYQGDCFGIELYRTGNDNLVRYNLVHDQYDTAYNPLSHTVANNSLLLGSGGIRFDGNNTMPSLNVTGNVAHNNIVYGEYQGFQIIHMDNVQIFNNTVYNDKTYADLGYLSKGIVIQSHYPSVETHTNNTLVKNNIIWGKYWMVNDYQSTNTLIDNNVYWCTYDGVHAYFSYNGAGVDNFSSWESGTGYDSLSVVSDPQLVEPTNDFYPQSYSPAIDSGTTEGISNPSPWLDYAGASVPQGGRVDIGAYEYDSSAVHYTITASAGAGGSITPSGAVSVASGESQYIAISPEAGYYIVNVVIDGISVGPIAGYSFAGISGNHTISAVFSSNWSRIYYVDPSSGNNSSTGTSETKAWQTLSKVNEMKFNPGDTIKLKSGQTFSAPLYVYQSGSAGDPIVFDSYGGTAFPVIDASGQAVGIRLLTQADVFGSGSDQLSYVMIRNVEIRNAGVAGGQSAGIWGAKVSNITIEGLSVHSCEGLAGIYIDGPNDHITINGNRVYDILSTTEARTAGYFGYGIVLSGTAGADNSSYNTISGNIVHNNHNSGISLSNSSDNTISENTVYLNGDCGIGLSEPGAHRNIIEKNEVYENCQYKDDRSGINLFLVGNDNIVRYNKTHSQYDTYNDPLGHGILINTLEGSAYKLGTCGIRFDGGHEGVETSAGNIVHTNLITNEGDGYQVYNFADTQFFNNTIYNSRRFGALVNGTHAASAVIKNNIISTMDASATVGGYKHLIMVAHATGYDINNNLYFPDGASMFNFNENRTNFSGWQGTGRDSVSVLADPRFVNVSTGDFSLQGTSSAIDLGTAEGITQPSSWKDLSDNDVPYSSTLPDAGAYESQTAPSVISGTVKASTAGNPAIQNVLVWLMDSNFAPVGDYVLTDSGGNFSINHEAIEGYLYVRPPTSYNAATGYYLYSYQPRIYEKGIAENTGIDIRLPRASNFVIEGRDQYNSLMDKTSFEAYRANGFSQFMTLTNTNEEIVPHVVWEIEDISGRKMPAIIVDADQSGGPFAIDVLFWQTASHGKLLLTADNAGSGYTLPAAGSGEVINLNQELLDTVNHRLSEKFGQTAATLDNALDLRDTLELSYARSAIDAVRKGTVEVTFKDLSGKVIKNAGFTIRQRTHDFMFGAFQGAGSAGLLFESDTDRQNAYTKAKEAGLGEITAVGLGWAYTEPYSNSLVDQRHGISSLKSMGYKVKVHGATWLWEGVLPERIKSSTNWADIISQNLSFRSTLLASFDAGNYIWEAMNEPAYNNYINMPRSNVTSLVEQAAAQTNASTNIVNGPHEFDFGAKYLFYGLDNEPVNDYPLTYSEFLRSVNMSNINTIGIQFYPGYRLTTEAEGPAMPPFWLADTVDRYGEMFPTKDIHITEFSVSSNGLGWTSGYWKNQWDTAMQSEYADRIFTLMYANPKVKSVIWWDILDNESSVVNGGLLGSGGTPKTAYNTLKTRITQDWSTNTTVESTSQGVASLTGFGGTYEVTYISPSQGTAINTEGQNIKFHISERSSGAQEVTLPVYTVTSTSGAHGTISPSGQIVTVESGSVTFAISAESGYAISSVLVDGVSVGALNSYTFSGISNSHTIEAMFTAVINHSPVLYPIGSKTTNEAQTLAFTVSGTDEDGAALVYSATGLPSGATFNTGTRTFNWIPTYSQAGVYTVTFEVSDGSLSSSEAVRITVTNVNRAPVLSAIGNKTTNEAQTLTFTVTGTDEDGTSLTYTMTGTPSGATFNTGTRVFSWTPSYSQAGIYTVTFEVSDGNLSSSEAVRITVNNVLQTFTITATAGAGGSISPAGAYSTQEGYNTTFIITASTGYSISNVRVDGASQGAVGTYTFSSITAAHTIEASFSMTLPSAPSGLGASAVSAARIDLSWTDNANNEDGYRIQRSPNGTGSWTTIGTVGAVTSYSNTGLSAHTAYYYRVYAYNSAGDSGYSNTANATTLNNDPVLAAIGNKTTGEAQTLSFTVSASDADTDAVTYEVTNAPTGAAFNTNSGVFSWTPTYSQSGTYSNVIFKARDIYGGSTQESITITVNNVNRAPVLSAIGSKATNEAQTLTFTVTGTDEDGTSLTYTMTGTPSGATFNTGTRVFSWTPSYSQAGIYTVTFEVSDGSLSSSEAVRITVTNVNRAPVLSAIGNKSVNENSVLSFTMSGSDDDGGILTYTMSGTPAGASLNTASGLFNWTPGYEQSGSYSVTFGVTDGSLSDTETILITVGNTNRRPALYAIGSKSVNENSLLTFTVSGTDEDGTALTYSAGGLPSGATFNTGTRVFSWTPSYSQSGIYSVIFSVSDGDLSSSETVNISVVNVVRTFTITASAGAGGSITPSGGVSVTEGDSRMFMITENSGYGISNVLVDGSPFGAISEYTFSTVSSDHSIEALFAFGLPAGPSALAATAASVSQIDLSWGDNAVNEEGYRIERSPNGSTGWTLISTTAAGSVSDSDTGLLPHTTYYYRVYAYNATGSSAYSNTAFTATLNTPPVLNFVGDKTTGEGSVLSFTVSADDGDSDALTYEAVSLPDGAAFNADTGVFYWVPSASQAGDNPVTFYARDAYGGSDSENITITVLSSETASDVYLPQAGEFSDILSTVITANWISGGNPDGTLYYCENITAGTNSGWISTKSYRSIGLAPDTAYEFRVKAKNTEGVESSWVSLGSQRTAAKRSFKSIKAGDIRLISGDVVGADLRISLEFDGVELSEITSVNFYLDDERINTSSISKSSVAPADTGILSYELVLSPGEHTLRIEAIDSDGNIYEQEFSGIKVYSSDTREITGAVLPYPNPYNSLAGDLRISYTLSADTDVAVYIFDMTGRLVSKSDHMSSMSGGSAGYNEVTWNGTDIFGSRVENDLYLVRIVDRSSGKLLGKCKVMVLKR